MDTNEKVKSFNIKISQKAYLEHKITVILLYQNDGYSLAESGDSFNFGSHQFLNWWLQHPTGVLRFDFRIFTLALRQ